MRPTRRSTLALMGGALALPYVRPSWAQAATINVYNWADYIGETTVQDFETETGIGVIYDLYPSSEEMQAKMLAGQTGYDLVLQAGMSLPQMVTAGIYQKLDRSKLTGWANLDPDILKIVEGFDPGNAYGSPYMWGSVGFTYNMEMVRERLPDADLSDLATIFDPANAEKLADCGISILDSPTDIGLTVLKYLGIDPDTTDVSQYDKVAEAFVPIRKYIRTFDNQNYLNAIPNGELCVINTWSGDYGVAKTRAAEAGIDMDLAYFVPKSGAPAWFDLWCLTAESKNVDPAHKFLDYLLRPEVIAACTDFTGYANANLAATPLVDPSISGDPAVYPDGELMARLWTPKPQNEEQDRALTRMWATVKAGG